MKKIAIVTQSYKNDYEECKLLCDSIDRFAPEIDHFIFVNDEDFKLFQSMNYGRHMVHKKGEILPWYLIRFPWKIMGHHFYISPFTIPVREWIVQQICKLGVFEVLGNEYVATFNIDSETVFMKPFVINKWINEKGDYFLFRNINDEEPSKDDYYAAAKNLFNISESDFEDISKWNYMNTPVCFEKENLKEILAVIGRRAKFGGWKRVLCNVYRFSEYYTYGLYSDYFLGLRNHYLTDIHTFPQIDMSWCKDENEFKELMMNLLVDDNCMGLWLQKGARYCNSENYLDINIIRKVITDYWDGNI